MSLYAKGMTTGDIEAHLFDVYGQEISRELNDRPRKVLDDLTPQQAMRLLRHSRSTHIIRNDR